MRKECPSCNSHYDEDDLHECEGCSELLCDYCMGAYSQLNGWWCPQCLKEGEEEAEHQREKMDWFNYGRHNN